MFGLGFGEIVLLAVIALLVFGPDKIPELMGTLGRWTRYFRSASTELRRTIESETRKIVPPDFKLPRIDDLLDPGQRRPIPGAADAGRGATPLSKATIAAARAAKLAGAASPGALNYGYGPTVPPQGPEPAPGGAAAGEGADAAVFDEEAGAEDVAADAAAAAASASRQEARRARVDAIARALQAAPPPPPSLSPPPPPGRSAPPAGAPPGTPDGEEPA